MRLGLVGPLPPVPSGPADYLAGMLPALARRCEVTCFVPDVDATDPALRAAHDVRPLDERADPAVDLLHYHLANNEHHAAVFEAAMAGPPGLAVVHDGSVHHLVAHRTLSQHQPLRYWSYLRDAHGDRGGALAKLRFDGHRAQIEQFLYDGLRGVVDRHLGALAHSRYAAELVRSRMPGLPVWVVPHYARPMAPALSKPDLGLPDGAFVVGHFGFITAPKRPYLLLEAFARVVQAGVAAHLLLAGKDDTFGRLEATVARLGLARHVTVTGYLDADRLEGAIQAVDAVVSLRSPHVAETSGTLTLALAAGKPVVVQQIGSWAEIPAAVAVHVPADGDEVADLAAAFLDLANDPARRAVLGDHARAHARANFDVDHCAGLVADASAQVLAGPRESPRAAHARHHAAKQQVLAGVPEPSRTRLAAVPAARPGQRLLVLGPDDRVAGPLRDAWGYAEVVTRPAADPIPEPAGSFAVVAWFDDRVVDLLDPAPVLAEVNRVLGSEGQVVLGPDLESPAPYDWSPPLSVHLGLAGFSVDRGGDDAVVAHKAGLPSGDRLTGPHPVRWTAAARR
ncbi:MAG: glycosyltransferase family 4 protein [Acidimicrobiia bacterium]